MNSEEAFRMAFTNMRVKRVWRVSQTRRIIERLQQGPATNAQLAAYSLKYTSRISDARALGYVIECSVLGKKGLMLYRLLTVPAA